MKVKAKFFAPELTFLPPEPTFCPPELLVENAGREAQRPLPELLERPDWLPATGPPRPPQRQFPPLETVTKPHLTTEELSFYTNTKPQTWRVKACYETYPPELKPVRIFGRLNWPTAGARIVIARGTR